jgi:hypothetical protein
MKRFLYLVQVERELPGCLRPLESDDSDVRFLSWKRPSSDPRSVFYPHSSWTQGRNRLYKEIEGTAYEYYVFLDDDVEMLLRKGHARNGWRAFEAFLLDYEPAVGVARYMWQLMGGGLDVSKPVQGIRFFDALVNAFHREAVHTLLPYCDLLDRYSEAYSQSLLCSLAADLYPGHVLQCNSVEVVNLQSRRPETEFLYCRAEDFYLASVRDARRYADFQRLTKGLYTTHRPFGVPSRKENRSYAVSEDELGRRFDLTHPMWVRRQEVVDLSKGSSYFSDSAETERARAWREEKASRLDPGAPAAPWHLRTRAAAIRAMVRTVRQSPRLAAVNRARKALSNRLRQRRADRHEQRLRRQSAPVAREIRLRWERWRLGTDTTYDVPDALTALRWVGWALSQIDTVPITMMDIGGLKEDTIRGLVDAMPQRPIVSVAVSAAEHPHYLHYGEFAMATVSSAPEDPTARRYRLSTLIRQFGLGHDILHVLAVEKQASNLDAVQSLDACTDACLFLRTTVPLSERASVEAFGFRAFAVAPSQSGPESDVIFVNVALLDRLLPLR